MSDPFIGEIIMFGGNFAPLGWAFCDGRIMSIAQNPALYSILGITFGGDGHTTFALPDMRSRVPVHAGQGPGLSNYHLGERQGSENVTLTANSMPSHTHSATASVTVNAGSRGDSNSPAGNFPGGGVEGTFASSQDAQMNAGMAAASVAVQPSGGGQPVRIVQPVLGINFIIALEGIYPPRS